MSNDTKDTNPKDWCRIRKQHLLLQGYFYTSAILECWCLYSLFRRRVGILRPLICVARM